MGNTNALGSSSTTAAVTVNNNAALDVNGNSVGDRNVSVTGAGPDGTSGAIVSSGTTDQQDAFRYVTLAGNTTFGGSGRWDIRNRGSGGSLSGGGRDLTKVGANLIALVNLGETGLGNIDVKNGTLSIEQTTTLGDTSKTITVESGAMLSLYQTGTNVLNKNLALQNATLGTADPGAGTGNTFGGNVSLTGSTTANLASGTSMVVSGNIGGTGKLTKTGSGQITLTGTNNTFSGGMQVDLGILEFGNGGAACSIPSSGDININGVTDNVDRFQVNTSSDVTINNKITGTGRGDIQKYGSGILTLANAANDYVGRTIIRTGGIRVVNNNSLGSNIAAGDTRMAGTDNTGGLLLDGSGGDLNIGELIYMDARRNTSADIRNVAGNNTLDAGIAGYTISFGAASGTSADSLLYNLEAAPGTKLTINGNVTYTGSTTSTYTVGISGGGTIEFGGTVSSGTAKLIIDVKQGTLKVGSSADIYAVSQLIIRSGSTLDAQSKPGGLSVYQQTLSGNGTVVGDIIDSGTSTFVPSDNSGVGKLTFMNNLTLSGGDSITCKINATTSDLLDVKGNMTLDSFSNTIINVLPNKVTTGIPYTVASVGGILSNGSHVTVDSSTTRYTFTPSVVGGNKIVLNASGSNFNLIWNGFATVWDLNSALSWNVSDTFYNGDDVTFNDTTGNTTVNINSEVRPASVTVDSTNDYTFSSSSTTAGRIRGDVGLLKKNSGTLIINLANDFTGQTTVQAGTLYINTGNIGPSPVLVTGGTLRVGNGGALGDATIGTTINGGTLDLNGQNLGAEPITVQGAGVSGNGVIINLGGAQNNALRYVTLNNDTTIGGTGRWDIRTDTPATTPAQLTGNGYKLTKVGGNTIYLVNLGSTGLGNIDLTAGGLGIQGSTTLGDSTKTLTVSSAATFNLFAVGSTNVLSKVFDFKGERHRFQRRRHSQLPGGCYRARGQCEL